MQTIVSLLALVAVASAGVAYPGTYISRAPAFDSAVIKSDRLGGNFAYSVAESHAYAAHTPVVQQVTSPVAVSYTAGAPVVSYSAPAVQRVAYAAQPAVAYAAQPAVTYAAQPAVSAYGYGGIVNGGLINGAYGYASPAVGYSAAYYK